MLNNNIKNIILIRMIRKGMSLNKVAKYGDVSFEEVNDLKALVDTVIELKDEGVSKLDISRNLNLSVEEINAIIKDDKKNVQNKKSYHTEVEMSVYPSEEIERLFKGYYSIDNDIVMPNSSGVNKERSFGQDILDDVVLESKQFWGIIKRTLKK